MDPGEGGGHIVFNLMILKVGVFSRKVKYMWQPNGKYRHAFKQAQQQTAFHLEVEFSESSKYKYASL